MDENTLDSKYNLFKTFKIYLLCQKIRLKNFERSFQKRTNKQTNKQTKTMIAMVAEWSITNHTS